MQVYTSLKKRFQPFFTNAQPFLNLDFFMDLIIENIQKTINNNKTEYNYIISNSKWLCMAMISKKLVKKR